MAGKGVLWDVGAGWCGDGGSGMGRGLCDCPRKGLVNLEVPCVSLRYRLGSGIGLILYTCYLQVTEL